jgi:nucleolar GTP-binding protein
MNFQNLVKVETADWYLDLAFRNAGKKASEMKSQMRARYDSIKKAELSKITEINRIIRKHLSLILTAFPSLDTLPEFYQELIRLELDYAELKKCLGALKWAEDKVSFFSNEYTNKVKRCQDFRRMTGYSREYYGRVSSVMKQIKKQLEYLEHARKVMKGFPSIKTKVFTVAIAGFPNVGKTTLLSRMTGSMPEIANYAFTTKNLNMGYADIDNHKVQFIDTPGTLNRFEKMNPVERQAYLAIKYCADIVVFVLDNSDQSYDINDQKKLLASVENVGKEVIIYLSKTDLKSSEIKLKMAKKKVFSTPEAVRAEIAKSL